MSQPTPMIRPGSAVGSSTVRVRAVFPKNRVRVTRSPISQPRNPAITAVAVAQSHAVDPAFDAISAARMRGFGAIDSWICRAPGGAMPDYGKSSRAGPFFLPLR